MYAISPQNPQTQMVLLNYSADESSKTSRMFCSPEWSLIYHTLSIYPSEMDLFDELNK